MSIEIGRDVVIPCPLVGFSLRHAINCLKCEHYQGMAQATINGEPIEGDDIDNFMVICGKPITRRMQKIVEN
jgi:hypothetical protein